MKEKSLYVSIVSAKIMILLNIDYVKWMIFKNSAIRISRNLKFF